MYYFVERNLSKLFINLIIKYQENDGRTLTIVRLILESDLKVLQIV